MTGSAVMAWLKAEREHLTAERRRERQDGVPERVLMARRLGKPEAPQTAPNRAFRRRIRRGLRVLGRRRGVALRPEEQPWRNA